MRRMSKRLMGVPPARPYRIVLARFPQLILVLLLLLSGWLLGAQTVPAGVTAENIASFASVLHVDFDDLPEDVGSVDSGWFTLSPDGRYAAVVRRDGGPVIYDTTNGDVAATYAIEGENGQPATVLDAAFGDDSQRLVMLHTDAESYYISVYELESDSFTVQPFTGVESDDDMPVRVWLDDESPHVWLEVAAGGMERFYYVVRLPLEGAGDQDVISLPSGPENDAESFVRIGRIPAPLAITATADGLVKLWNLESGAITATVQLEVPPVFGRVDETTGRYLAWRDPASESLNLLDFEMGTNRVIAPLGGEYVQAILVTPAADLVFAVAIGDDPVVVAWDVEAEVRYDLGEYRECSRVPDMIALSRDASTLVIGCGVGLDIWRVTEDND